MSVSHEQLISTQQILYFFEPLKARFEMGPRLQHVQVSCDRLKFINFQALFSFVSFILFLEEKK